MPYHYKDIANFELIGITWKMTVWQISWIFPNEFYVCPKSDKTFISAISFWTTEKISFENKKGFVTKQSRNTVFEIFVYGEEHNSCLKWILSRRGLTGVRDNGDRMISLWANSFSNKYTLVRDIA